MGEDCPNLGKPWAFSSPLPERCEKSQLGFEASSYRLASAFRVKVLPYLSEQSPPSRFSLLISISVWSLLCSKDYVFKSNPLSLSIVLSKRTESNNLAHQYQKQKSICSFLKLCLPLAHVVPLFPTQFPTWLCCPFQSTMGSGLKCQCSLAKSPYMLALSSLYTFPGDFTYFLDFTAWDTHELQTDASRPTSSPVRHNICLLDIP